MQGYFRALCRLARVWAQCEPSESENKTNDGNGGNYIYGHVLIWLVVTPFSISLPCLSPFSSLWTTATRSASPLFPFLTLSTSIYLPFSRFYHLCLCRQVRRDVISLLLTIYSHSDIAEARQKSQSAWHQSDRAALSLTVNQLFDIFSALWQSFKKALSRDINIFKLTERVGEKLDDGHENHARQCLCRNTQTCCRQNPTGRINCMALCISANLGYSKALCLCASDLDFLKGHSVTI